MWAAYYDRLKTVELLLKAGADPNAKDKQGNTALIVASSRGYPKVAELLLKNGAHLNLKNENDRTALDLATRNNREKVRKILLRHGAKR